MNREKFIVTLQYSDKEVEGCRFTVKDFEFLDLFVYEHDGTFALGELKTNEPLYMPEELKGKYVVSDAHTGKWFGDVCNHPEEAAYKAELRLREIGVERAKWSLEMNRR